MKQILGKIRRAADDYNMIEEDETIAVGVSGGKDSMLLLKSLVQYSRFSPVSFGVHAVCLDMGFGAEFSPLKEFCRELDVPLTIRDTRIGEIVFDVRQEKNPCALCANLKRGALHNTVKELGISKLALGHHADDFMETFLMSLIFEGRTNVFKAVTYLDRKAITVIRPMIYIRESEIIYAANKENVPVVKSGCPADGATSREEMKNLIKQLEKKYPGSSKRIFTAVKKYMDESL